MKPFVKQRGFVLVIFLAVLPIVSGCVPTISSHKSVRAVRLVSHSNTNFAIEKIIAADTEIGLAMLFTPEGPGTAHISQKQTFYLQTVGKVGLNMVGPKRAKIKNLPNPKDTGDLYNWNFWPVPGTNLWIAVNTSSNRFEKGSSNFDHDTYLKVYLFNSEKVIQQKELLVFVPEHGNGGYPDIRFDAPLQAITYNTRNGHKIYYFSADTIAPCAAPAGEPALPIKNSGAEDDAPFLVFHRGKYYPYYIKENN